MSRFAIAGSSAAAGKGTPCEGSGAPGRLIGRPTTPIAVGIVAALG